MINKAESSRSFAWMNTTQFLGAMNDNVFRLLVAFFLLEMMGDEHRFTILATTTVLFVLPFLLFSQAAGVLADRISKRSIIVFAKCLETVVMLAGCLAVFLGMPVFLYCVVFFMSTQSALFGPSKYGIIPELVEPQRLSRANGLVVGATYLAIIIGMFVPSFLLLQVLNRSFIGVAFFCAGVAALGVMTGLRIEKTPAHRSTKRLSPLFPVEIYRTLRDIKKDRYLFLSVFADAYFPFIGGFMQQNILLYAQESLNMGWIQSGYLFPVAALGIGAGALLAGRLSGRNIEYGLVPVGALGLTGACLALYVSDPGILQAMFILFAGGVSGGLFIVPLDAFIQFRSPANRRGEILACVNFLGFSGVALSAGVIKVFGDVFGMTAGQGFLAMGLLTGVVAIAAVALLPDFLMRFIAVLLARIFYRIRVRGSENLPFAGPALLIPNHVTWVDSLFLSAAAQRRIRFLLSRKIYENRWMNPLFRLTGVIPVSPADKPREIVESLRQAREALDQGFLVCIFAEGAITRNGNMHSFKNGFEHIVKGTSHPVIPVHIGGAWGSVFSYFHGRLLGALPSLRRRAVSVAFGKPMPPDSTALDARNAVMELSTGSFETLHPRGSSLAGMFVESARRNWFRPAVSDTTGKRLTYGRTLIAALAFSAQLKRELKDQRIAGVLLPACVGAALSNIALVLLGKVPVNLNFTVSSEAFSSSIRQSGIRTIISSRAFLDRMKEQRTAVSPPDECRMILLEDVVASVSKFRKIKSLFKAAVYPSFLLGPGMRRRGRDLATIIFSSGSTGDPKGIMLSHDNIISNIKSVCMLYRFKREDRMCAFLPLFHSFGLTCTLWCPFAYGFSAHYHPNPLDVSKIAEMVREERLTILLATPAFLLSHVRRTAPEDFASLRVVITGAEKLTERMSDSFSQKFGIQPMEGYGATELSPVASLNVPDVTIDRVRQPGHKLGSIGHPVPGVAMKIVKVETGEPVALGESGLLLVKGPNVMMGYLDMPQKTAEVLQDGWYNTGDIAKMDEDGFVFLQDRLSRFSKIAGEMVPHGAIEEKFHELLGFIQRVLAIGSARDELKGEQLVVFHLDEAGESDVLHETIARSNLPNLWKPKRQHFQKVESLPILGSGKLDLTRLRRMAKEFLENKKRR